MAKPRVSDHALIRYMERVMGLNFDNMRKRILNEDVRNAMDIGASQIPCPDDDSLALVIEGHCVKTIAPRVGPKGARARARAGGRGR